MYYNSNILSANFLPHAAKVAAKAADCLSGSRQEENRKDRAVTYVPFMRKAQVFHKVLPKDDFFNVVESS